MCPNSVRDGVNVRANSGMEKPQFFQCKDLFTPVIHLTKLLWEITLRNLYHFRKVMVSSTISGGNYNRFLIMLQRNTSTFFDQIFSLKYFVF